MSIIEYRVGFNPAPSPLLREASCVRDTRISPSHHWDAEHLQDTLDCWAGAPARRTRKPRVYYEGSDDSTSKECVPTIRETALSGPSHDLSRYVFGFLSEKDEVPSLQVQGESQW